LASVDQWTQSLYEELGSNIEGINKDLYREYDKEIQGEHLDIRVTETLTEGMQWKVMTQLAEAEDGAGHGDSGNIVTGAERVKSQRFNGFISSAMFHHQFEATARNNNCVPMRRPHTYLPFCRGRPPMFYIAFLEKWYTKTLLKHLRVAVETMEWLQHTVLSLKSGLR
jgi:hypothetical protein